MKKINYQILIPLSIIIQLKIEETQNDQAQLLEI
jgi:hypothetical protein